MDVLVIVEEVEVVVVEELAVPDPRVNATPARTMTTKITTIITAADLEKALGNFYQ